MSEKRRHAVRKKERVKSGKWIDLNDMPMILMTSEKKIVSR